MAVTICVQFCDDSGGLHEFATISEKDFGIIHRGEHVEYQIATPEGATHELGKLVDMTGTRPWHFRWMKAGKDGGLSVRRIMRFDRISEGILVLRTADIVGRSRQDTDG